jgi:hypothetical protein
MAKQNADGTAAGTKTKPTQIGEAINIFITALTTVIDEFKISDVINALKNKGDKLSHYLRLVIRAFMEDGEIKLFKKQLFPGNEYLKLVSGDEKIIISACKGGYVITEDTATFAYIDPDFKKYKDANEPSKPTPSMRVGVYELQKTGTSQEIFDSITKYTEIMELTLEQLVIFCIEHIELLSKNGSTSIVYKNSKNKFFVANVHVDDFGRLWVIVLRLKDDNEWNAESRHRVVLPELDVMS